MSIKLFGVSQQDNRLCWRDVESTETWSGNWGGTIKIPDTVKSMTGIGTVCFFATARSYGKYDGTLAAVLAASYTPVMIPPASADIGHVAGAAALASIGTTLYVYTTDRKLYQRDAIFSNIDWREISGPSKALEGQTVYAMTELGGRLTVATSSDRLYQRRTLDSDWEPLSNSYMLKAKALTATSTGRLFALHRDTNDLLEFVINRWVVRAASQTYLVKAIAAVEALEPESAAASSELRTGTDG